MKKHHKYWLDQYGERYWYLESDPTITAYRAYYWVDRISYIHEGAVTKSSISINGLTTSNRRYLSQKEFDHPTTYTEFKKEKHRWIPIKDYFLEYIPILQEHLEIQKYNL